MDGSGGTLGDVCSGSLLDTQVESAAVTVTGTENGLTTTLDTFVEHVRSRWPTAHGAPRVVTRSPGRLDLMGGMGDFSGSLALQIPTEVGVFVAAGLREDQRVYVETLGGDGHVQPSRWEWPLSWLYQAGGRIVPTSEFSGKFEPCPWVRHVAGVCHSLLEAGYVTHFAGGMTIFLASDIPSEAGLAASAAIQVAVAKALAALFEPGLSEEQILAACRKAVPHVPGATVGLVDHPTCLWGRADALLQIRCRPFQILGHVALPANVRVAAVASGVRLPIYHQRYEDNRIAALMGKYLINRLIAASGDRDGPTGEYLANIAPSEYVRRFRNELPVKMKGADFLAHYGQPEPGWGAVVPDRIYKIRSRAEHHIYENDRTHRFMERLGRARRTGERDALIEAGELMYASHWSYGQRCGMGSVETDVLVNLIRERGAARGLYGAKVTGAGCGGAVAVLMSDQPAAEEALSEACRAYTSKTGRPATILRGSSPGATAFGVRKLD